MSNPDYPDQGTSAALEKVALERYRHLVEILPPNCRLFREPWGNSTVLCLDFRDCLTWLPIMQQSAEPLLEASEKLGLAQALLFRQGQKFMGLKTRSPIY